MKSSHYSIILYCIVFAMGCSHEIKSKNDEIYSRQLQRHIQLQVVATPFSEDKSNVNLIILNDATLMKIPLKNIVDSLYKIKAIGEILVVNIVSFDPEQLFGVSGTTKVLKNGALSEKYAQFIVNELLPFTKKKIGERKFKSISFAGQGLGAISALDITWDDWQKFDNVGIFSGYADYKLLIQKIMNSKKGPKMNYWFYNISESHANPSIKDDESSVNSLLVLLQMKGIPLGNIHTNSQVQSWRNEFANFLISVSN